MRMGLLRTQRQSPQFNDGKGPQGSPMAARTQTLSLLFMAARAHQQTRDRWERLEGQGPRPPWLQTLTGQHPGNPSANVNRSHPDGHMKEGWAHKTCLEPASATVVAAWPGGSPENPARRAAVLDAPAVPHRLRWSLPAAPRRPESPCPSVHLPSPSPMTTREPVTGV